MANARKHVIFRFRSDLRLTDNPAFRAAVETGRPVVPVYVLDDAAATTWRMGSASRWWLHRSLENLDSDLRRRGFHPLVFLRGDSIVQIASLAQQTKAEAVFWTAGCEPFAVAQDRDLREFLEREGICVVEKKDFLLFAPGAILNKSGEPYRVFTPFSKACFEKERLIDRPDEAVPGPPVSADCTFHGLSLEALDLLPSVRWHAEMEEVWSPGEAGASGVLGVFLTQAGHYRERRDFPAEEGVSRLSPHLHFGEISARRVWHATRQAHGQAAEPFLRQLLWREFSWHLLSASPDMADRVWNPSFVHFPWKQNRDALLAWQRGMTGYPIVDAGMRQLWRTGWMHNRARMIVGSFLVKHLLIDWREGERWFWDTLVDADLGNNASGWQWIAGSGADAAPYFRIFNPVLQGRKFDAEGTYIRKYIPELAKLPGRYLHAPWEASPMLLMESGVTLGQNYPFPIVDHATARARALEAYEQSRTKRH